MPEEVEHIVVEVPEETPADVDAARAAASAEAAHQAAEITIAQATAASAEVAMVAASEIEAYQERLAVCEQSYSAILATAESSQARLAELEQQNRLILQQLAQRQEASPPKSAQDPPNGDEPKLPEPTEARGDAPLVAPQELEKPERRRAHRWI